ALELLIQRLGGEFKLEVVDAESEIGSGALPVELLKTRAIRITHPAKTPDAIAAMFRHARPAVIGRISNGAFYLDLRTVEDPAALAVEFGKSG
ncbi:MAG TPA: hypothetical protein VJN94_08840, partial [Candidatus Binataceae bacterium]|nr:hypothetical protein [Candidatus Binataceae bacterium]